MNNIKKINFNDTKKSPSKNTTRRDIKSNERNSSNNYNNSKIKEIKYINKKVINNKHNISNSAAKYNSGEKMVESHINLRKRKPK